MNGATLEQQQLLPSACQIWHRYVVASSPSGNLIAYASTLSVCVFDISSKPVSLKRVLSLDETSERSKSNILTIAWHPTEEDILVSASESDIVLWSLSAPRAFQSTTHLPAQILQISWCIRDPTIIAIACMNTRIYEWVLGTSIFAEYFARPTKLKFDKTTEIANVTTALAWHPDQNYLLCGLMDGSWVSCDKTSDRLRVSASVTNKHTNLRVVDMSWDKLGGSYALVAHQSSHIVLWDVRVELELRVFDVAKPELRWVSFLDFSPGAFVTFSDSEPTATLWNVSHASPIDEIDVMASMNVGSETINDLPISHDNLRVHSVIHIQSQDQRTSTSMLLSLIDGSVAVWCWRRRSVVWRSTPGHTETIFQVAYNPRDSTVLASSSYDGSINIWHAPSMTITSVLHTVDVRILPETISMHSQAASEGFGSILYSVDWSPDGKELVAASFSGSVFIFNLATGDIRVHLKQLHNGPCYKCDWYCGKDCDEDGLIASAGGDGKVVIFDRRGNILRSFNASKGCFGCHWCPFIVEDYAFLAVGSIDAQVLVYKVNVSKKDGGDGIASLQYILRGHTERVFHVCWSPLIPGLLASSSDDKTVRIWLLDIKVLKSSVSGAAAAQLITSFARVLEGHVSRVRPLLWSYEIPSLLFTGSWDCSIKLWDVSTGSLLNSINNHSADVYGLASHPDRPFALVSSSRDNTLRFWKFDCRELSIAKLTCLVEGNLPRDLIGDAPLGKDMLRYTTDQMSYTKRDKSHPFPLLLAGSASKKLATVVKEAQSETGGVSAASMKVPSASLVVWKECLCLWQGFDQEDIWFLMGGALGKTGLQEPVFRRFVQTSSVLELKHAQALLLESYRAGLTSRAHRKDSGVSGLKKKDALRMAAEIHLKCGRFEDACQVLVEIGRWEEAIMLAPAASLGYWQRLMKEYAQVAGDTRLFADRRDNSGATLFTADNIYLLLASGRVMHAINLLVHRMQFMDALIVACGYFDGRFESSSRACVVQESKYEDAHVEGRKAVEVVCSLIARHHIEHVRSISGACMLVSAGSYENAVRTLIRGNDIDTAFAITSCFVPAEPWAVRTRQVLLYALSLRAKGLGNRIQSLELMIQADVVRSDAPLGKLIDTQLYAALLASDVDCSDQEKTQLMSLGGIRKTERELVEEAIEEDGRSNSDVVRVVRNYLLALRHADAVEVLLRQGGLLDRLSQEWGTWRDLDISNESHKPPDLLLVSLIHHVNGLNLLDTIQKRKLVGCACWLGGWLGEAYSLEWVPGICLQSIAAAMYRRARCIGMGGPPQHTYLLAEAACVLRDKHRVANVKYVESLIEKTVQTLPEDHKDGDVIERSRSWVHRFMKQQADAVEEAAALVSPKDHESVIDNVLASSPKDILTGMATAARSPLPAWRAGASKSILDEAFIPGPAVLLEDGHSSMSAGDAVMWNWLNPFSPLATGERIYTL